MTTETPQTKIVDALIVIRKRKKLSQRRLAQKAGVSQRTVWKLETHKTCQSDILFSVLEAAGLQISVQEKV